MGKFVGRRGALGVANEATRGTAVTPAYWIPYASISFDDKVEKARETSAFANIQDSDSAFVTQKYAEGEFEAELRDKSLGAILKAVMGSVSSAVVGGDATVYDHTFSVLNSNQHPSLSLCYQDPNETIMFSRSMVDSFKLKVEPKGIVTYTVGFKANPSQDYGTRTTDFTSLGYKFLHQHLSFKVAANLAGLAAASALDIIGLELEIKKNAETEDSMGTLTPTDIFNKQISVEGKIIVNRTDNTFKNYMKNGDYKAIEIKFTDTNTIGNSSKTTLTIQMPRVDWYDWEQDRSLDDLVTEEIAFKGNFDATNADNIIDSVVLRNLVTSY